jgi:hypothetical protein
VHEADALRAAVVTTRPGDYEGLRVPASCHLTPPVTVRCR